MKKYAVIVAGGSGKRMETRTPKQFLDLNGKPVLWYTLDTFLRSYNDMQIILVLPEDHIAKGKEIVATLDQQRVQITKGGETRFHSVQNGLMLINVNSVVFVHDGVRCLISVPLIHRCYRQAIEKGSAIPAITASDSIRFLEGSVHNAKDRQMVRLIQTPQTFLSTILIPAFNNVYNSAFTDEATVVEASGEPVFLTEGEYDNIKITRPIDLFIAEKIIQGRLSLKEPIRP